MREHEKSDPREVDSGRTLGFDELPAARPSGEVGRPEAMEIEVVGGPMDGHRASVRGSALTIGRSEDNDLVVGLDSTVSSHHARIVREGDRFWLEDLDSRNGTYIGSCRLRGERVPIGAGSLFTVGRTEVEFLPR